MGNGRQFYPRGPRTMAFFSFTFLFSLVLAVTIAVHSNSTKNCSVSYLKTSYRQHIYKDLQDVLKNCTTFDHERFRITIGNETWNNTSRGFLGITLTTYNFTQVLCSIFHHAQNMKRIDPVKITIFNLRACMESCNGTAVEKVTKRRRRRNVLNKEQCLETMGLRELWRIYFAYPDHHHAKTN